MLNFVENVCIFHHLRHQTHNNSPPSLSNLEEEKITQNLNRETQT